MAKSRKLRPEDLQTGEEFELLQEVSHQNLKEFIVEQISTRNRVIGIYSVYQILLMLIFAFFFTRSLVYLLKGHHEPFLYVGLAILFSFTLLIVIHELIHAIAYLLTGSRRISFGFIPRKFIFYALADRQVIATKDFFAVALAPFVAVKMICLAGIAFFWGDTPAYFFATIMCLHSLFCAGDIAMLAFYRIHNDKEIYNFDVQSEGKTYFYIRKSDSKNLNQEL
jgi:hypothetical protein